MKDEREKYTHPSFGQIRFARVNGKAKFYGSELEQDHYIEMTLQESEVEKELARDWYHATKEIVSVRMTSNQFAEMITSMNHEGIPCTIQHIKGQKVMPLPDIESRKELTHRMFEERMRQFAATIKKQQQQAKELVKKKTLSKDDMQQLNFHLEWLTGEIERNIPFFMECFQETMDKVVIEAKQEVENAIQHKINVLGLAALHEQSNLLEQQNK